MTCLAEELRILEEEFEQFLLELDETDEVDLEEVTGGTELELSERQLAWYELPNDGGTFEPGSRFPDRWLTGNMGDCCY